MSDSPRSATATSHSGGDGWVTWASLDNVWAVTDDDDSTFEEIDLKLEDISFETAAMIDTNNSKNPNNASNVCEFGKHGKHSKGTNVMHANNPNNPSSSNTNVTSSSASCKRCDSLEQALARMVLSLDTRVENEVKKVEKLWKMERTVRKNMYNKLQTENKQLRAKLAQMDASGRRGSVTTNSANITNITNIAAGADAPHSPRSAAGAPDASAVSSAPAGEGKVGATSGASATTSGAAGGASGAGASEGMGRSSGVVTKLFSVFKAKNGHTGSRHSKSSKRSSKDDKDAKDGRERLGIFSVGTGGSPGMQEELGRMDTAISEILRECHKGKDRFRAAEHLECVSSMNKVETLVNVLNAEIESIRSNTGLTAKMPLISNQVRDGP